MRGSWIHTRTTGHFNQSKWLSRPYKLVLWLPLFYCIWLLSSGSTVLLSNQPLCCLSARPDASTSRPLPSYPAQEALPPDLLLVSKCHLLRETIWKPQQKQPIHTPSLSLLYPLWYNSLLPILYHIIASLSSSFTIHLPHFNAHYIKKLKIKCVEWIMSYSYVHFLHLDKTVLNIDCTFAW